MEIIGKNKVELKQWTNEAGPRQVNDVQRAFNRLLNAGGGTLYKRTSPMTGEHYETIETVFIGSASTEEVEHKEANIHLLNSVWFDYEGTITRTNCRQIIEAVLKHVPAAEASRPVVDERKTPEQVQTEKEEREAARRTREESAKKATVTRQTAADTVAKEYPYLNRIEDDHPSGVEVAKNIRLMLKKEFPGIKFSVKSDYSSIRIRWTDGPTVKQVEKHVNKFNAGTFDGMTDCQGWEPSAFTDAFGGVRYIFTGRDYSDEVAEAREKIHAELVEKTDLPEYELTNRARNIIDNTDLRNVDVSAFQGVDWPESGCYQLHELKANFYPLKVAKREVHRHGKHGVTIEEHTHTKKGFQMWIVCLSERVEREEYTALLSKAKSAGGWYSRKWGDCPAGFAFKDPAAAEKFAAEIGGTEPEPTGTDDPNPAPSQDGHYRTVKAPGTQYGKANTAKAENLRKMSQRLDSQIEDKTRPMTQNPTPKRTLEYQRRKIDGAHLQRAQKVMHLLADGHEAGTLSEVLKTVRTKKDILHFTKTLVKCPSYYEIIDTGDFVDSTVPGEAVQKLLEEGTTDAEKLENEEREKEQVIKSKILELTGQKIPGFFPTPEAVTARMLEELDIQEGDEVLEPSAGTGNLADVARTAGGSVLCIEVRNSLAEILKLKDHKTILGDFRALDFVEVLSKAGLEEGQRFDKVIMNPPFEKGQDIDHVRHAYRFLKPGGRLAAIMCEGVFFRSDSKSAGFRGWLSEVGGISEKLPDGSFKGTGEVSTTGTASRLVVIHK